MARAYPRVVIDLSALRSNASYLIDRCLAQGVAVAGVIKGFNGLIPPARVLADVGASQLASSRTEQLAAVKAAGIRTPTLLLRVPMRSELAEVVRTSDYSLQSEIAVLDALDLECARQGRTHRVIVMADLGDLREGFFDREEMLRVCVHVERELKHVELAGVGTNLGCYGSITPTPEKLMELVDIAERVEAAIGRRLSIISGGASSSYPLVHHKTMPARVNHLRIGEGICLASLLLDGWGLPDLPLSRDAFLLEAEVVECKDKPTYPVGEIAFDAFGNRPTYTDRGIRRRALLGVGKVDVGDVDWLYPRTAGMQILGGSSDHTIADVADCDPCPAVGDTVTFRLGYGAMVFLTGRPDVTVVYRPAQEPTR